MASYPGVQIKVKSVRGVCPIGHKVGDTFKMLERTPEGICNSAFPSILDCARTLQYGGRFPWDPTSETALIGCSDSVNTVVFEISVDHSQIREAKGGKVDQ